MGSPFETSSLLLANSTSNNISVILQFWIVCYYRIEHPTSHGSPAAETNRLQLDGIFIAQAVRGQREAYDLVSVNRNDTAAPCVAIAGEFEYGCNAELGQLPLGYVEK